MHNPKITNSDEMIPSSISNNAQLVNSTENGLGETVTDIKCLQDETISEQTNPETSRDVIEPMFEESLIIEPKIQVIKDYLMSINLISGRDGNTLECLLKQNEPEAVNKALKLLEDINQRHTLYQCLREIETGFKIGSEVNFLGSPYKVVEFREGEEVCLQAVGEVFTVTTYLSQIIKV